MTTKNFEDLTGQKLVEQYNWMADLAQVRHVKKFETRDVGVKRCRELHEKLLARDLVEQEAPPKGVAPTEATATAPAKADQTEEAPMPAKAKVSMKSASPSKRSDMRIKMLVSDNPRRPGSDAHKHFTRMAASTTVGQYLGKFKVEERRKASQWLSNTVKDGFAKVGA